MIPSSVSEFKEFESDRGTEGRLKDDFMGVLFNVGHAETFLGRVETAKESEMHFRVEFFDTKP
jgi:hypothetical protein